jgi:Lrp/AsnC family leucine-responsive transcriptional regulator
MAVNNQSNLDVFLFMFDYLNIDVTGISNVSFRYYVTSWEKFSLYAAVMRKLDDTSGKSAEIALDDADRRLLNALQRDNRRSVAELAAAAGLTPQTCHRRLQRLRESGLIVREAALVDQQRSPLPLTAVIEVAMERLSATVRADFETRMRETREVLQCYAVSGPNDYILVVALADVADYSRFMQEHLASDEAVKHFKGTLSVVTVKQTTIVDF